MFANRKDFKYTFLKDIEPFKRFDAVLPFSWLIPLICVLMASMTAAWAKLGYLWAQTAMAPVPPPSGEMCRRA